MSYEEYLAANNLQNIRSNDAPSAGRAPYANLNAPDANPFEGLRDLESKAWACDALAVTVVTFTLGTPGTLNLLGPGAGDFISAADIVDGVYYANHLWRYFHYDGYQYGGLHHDRQHGRSDGSGL